VDNGALQPDCFAYFPKRTFSTRCLSPYNELCFFSLRVYVFSLKTSLAPLYSDTAQGFFHPWEPPPLSYVSMTVLLGRTCSPYQTRSPFHALLNSLNPPRHCMLLDQLRPFNHSPIIGSFNICSATVLYFLSPFVFPPHYASAVSWILHAVGKSRSPRLQPHLSKTFFPFLTHQADLYILFSPLPPCFFFE